MEDEDAETRHRLEEIRDFYIYVGREMPALLDRLATAEVESPPI